MAFPVTLNSVTYTLADFEGLNYVDGFPGALEDFVTEAGTRVTAAQAAQTAAEVAQAAAEAALDAFDDRFLGTKSSEPALDNDGNALADGALFFDTTENVMKVYDLGNTDWKQVTPTTAEQANIDTVSGISANISTVAANDTNITTVATNIADVNTFAETYRIAATAPSTSLDEGDLYFNTNDNKVQVYNGSAWQDVAPTATSITASQISDVTASAADLNLLDGVTATTAEINYLDGVSSNLQTQIDNIPSGGVTSFTAAEAISAGDAVALKSDGEVEKIFGAVQDVDLYAAGDEIEIYAANAGIEEDDGIMLEIPGTNRAVWIFKNDANNRMSAQILSVSGTTPTKVGAEQVLFTSGGARFFSATWDTSTSDTFVIFFMDGSASDVGYAYVCTISGDTISLGAQHNVTTAMGIQRCELCAISYDPVEDKFLLASKDIYNDGDMIVATRAGTSLTFGSRVRFETGSAYGISLVYDASIGAHLLTYYDSLLTAKSITISGTVPTVQATATSSALSWNGGGSVEHISQNVVGNGAGRFVGVYRGRAVLFTATNATVSVDDVFSVAAGDTFSYWSLTYDPYATHPSGRGLFVIVLRDGDNDDTSLEYAYLSSTNVLSFGAYADLVDGSNRAFRKGFAIQYIANQASILACGQWGNTGPAQAMAFALAANFSNADKFAGFAEAAVAEDASGNFTVIGGTNTQQSGLTIGSLHYLTGGGSLTTTATDYPSGLARSATSIDVGATAADFVADSIDYGAMEFIKSIDIGNVTTADITDPIFNDQNFETIVMIKDLRSGSTTGISEIRGYVILDGVLPSNQYYTRSLINDLDSSSSNEGQSYWRFGYFSAGYRDTANVYGNIHFRTLTDGDGDRRVHHQGEFYGFRDSEGTSHLRGCHIYFSGGVNENFSSFDGIRMNFISSDTDADTRVEIYKRAIR